jgi:uncharacterized coiled-coil protein SlyX
MTDFERIEQAIAEQEPELQRLESEIQEKRQMLDRQKQALSLLQPLGQVSEPDVAESDCKAVGEH